MAKSHLFLCKKIHNINIYENQRIDKFTIKVMREDYNGKNIRMDNYKKKIC